MSGAPDLSHLSETDQREVAEALAHLVTAQHRCANVIAQAEAEFAKNAADGNVLYGQRMLALRLLDLSTALHNAGVTISNPEPGGGVG